MAELEFKLVALDFSDTLPTVWRSTADVHKYEHVEYQMTDNTCQLYLATSGTTSAGNKHSKFGFQPNIKISWANHEIVAYLLNRNHHRATTF